MSVCELYAPPDESGGARLAPLRVHDRLVLRGAGFLGVQRLVRRVHHVLHALQNRKTTALQKTARVTAKLQHLSAPPPKSKPQHVSPPPPRLPARRPVRLRRRKSPAPPESQHHLPTENAGVCQGINPPSTACEVFTEIAPSGCLGMFRTQPSLHVQCCSCGGWDSRDCQLGHFNPSFSLLIVLTTTQ